MDTRRSSSPRSPPTAVIRAALLLLGVCAAACASPPTRPRPTPPPSAPAHPVEALSGAPPEAAPAPAPPAFEAGCDVRLGEVLPPRVELVRSMEADRWPWACKAKARFGEPVLRASGYPDFRVRDVETGACLVVSLEDIGAFVYYAPPGRGEALRAELERTPTTDCTFEVGIDGLGPWPMRVGVKNGQALQEPLYPPGLEGARQHFAQHPNEASAAKLIDAWLQAKTQDRPSGWEAELEQAASRELDAFDRMDAAWLSGVGKQGYCARTRDLGRLPLTPAARSRVSAASARFCRA